MSKVFLCVKVYNALIEIDAEDVKSLKTLTVSESIPILSKYTEPGLVDPIDSSKPHFVIVDKDGNARALDELLLNAEDAEDAAENIIYYYMLRTDANLILKIRDELSDKYMKECKDYYDSDRSDSNPNSNKGPRPLVTGFGHSCRPNDNKDKYKKDEHTFCFWIHFDRCHYPKETLESCERFEKVPEKFPRFYRGPDYCIPILYKISGMIYCQ